MVWRLAGSSARSNLRQSNPPPVNPCHPAVPQMATALYFIDKLALRAGHEKDEDEADTVGCCTLKVGGWGVGGCHGWRCGGWAGGAGWFCSTGCNERQGQGQVDPACCSIVLAVAAMCLPSLSLCTLLTLTRLHPSTAAAAG